MIIRRLEIEKISIQTLKIITVKYLDDFTNIKSKDSCSFHMYSKYSISVLINDYNLTSEYLKVLCGKHDFQNYLPVPLP